jgi:hypothetical protein
MQKQTDDDTELGFFAELIDNCASWELEAWTSHEQTHPNLKIVANSGLPLDEERAVRVSYLADRINKPMTVI